MVPPPAHASRVGRGAGDGGISVAAGRSDGGSGRRTPRARSRVTAGGAPLQPGAALGRAGDGRIRPWIHGGAGARAVSDARYDVVVVGGGPGGSAAATFLSRGGLNVALFERETFPRFHVGESLMPAVMLLLDQMGVRREVGARGLPIQYGRMVFHPEHG